jgi:hypothetical protein
MATFVSYTADISYIPQNTKVCTESCRLVLCRSATCFQIRREEHKSGVSENLGCVPYRIISSNLTEYEPSP